MNTTMIKSAGIENPYCKVQMGRLVAGFDIGTDRYHVWLTKDGKAIQQDKYSGKENKGQTLYKNCGLSINRHDPGYFQTKYLDATAKCNAALIAELLASIDPGQAWIDYQKEQEAEQAAREKEGRENIEREALQKAAPELLKQLEYLVGIICGGERDVNLEDCDEAKSVIARAKAQ